MPKENPFGITFEKRKERKHTNERRRNESCFPVGSVHVHSGSRTDLYLPVCQWCACNS